MNTRRWGQGENAGSTERAESGRFRSSHRCDACGKSTNEETRFTDEEVCGSSDGPGFYLCARKACKKARDLPVEVRRVLYEGHRAKNNEVAPVKLTKPWTPSDSQLLRVLDTYPAGVLFLAEDIAGLLELTLEQATVVGFRLACYGRVVSSSEGWMQA